MRPPPSNRSLVLSFLGTALCLGVVYWAVQTGERSKKSPASTPANAIVVDAGVHD